MCSHFYDTYLKSIVESLRRMGFFNKITSGDYRPFNDDYRISLAVNAQGLKETDPSVRENQQPGWT